MKANKEFQILETGETIDDLSLDMILGGVAQSASTDCEHCNTCGSGGNNSHNEDEPQYISMG